MKQPSAALTAILLPLTAAAPLSSGAQVLYLSPSAIAPSIGHSFGQPPSSVDNQNLTLPTPGISLRNYNTIQVAVNAPAGYAWWVHGDPSFLRQNLGVSLAYDNSFFAPYASITSASLDFNFIQGGPGNLSTPVDNDFFPTPGDRFDLSRAFSLNGDVAFTSFTMTVGFDTSALSSDPLSDFGSARLYFLCLPGSCSDPGQRLTLAVAPEPGFLSLSGLGLAAFGCASRCRRPSQWPAPVP
jgi:hypothetical protein